MIVIESTKFRSLETNESGEEGHHNRHTVYSCVSKCFSDPSPIVRIDLSQSGVLRPKVCTVKGYTGFSVSRSLKNLRKSFRSEISLEASSLELMSAGMNSDG